MNAKPAKRLYRPYSISHRRPSGPLRRAFRLVDEAVAVRLGNYGQTTCTGVYLEFRVPSPSLPYELSPHAQRVPSDLSATVW